jgi:hypothetical protein
MRTRNSRLGLLVVSILLLVAAAVPGVRRSLLRASGAALVTTDPVTPSDVGVITEFGEGSELEAADLFHAKMFSRVVVLEPAPTPVDREYARRGVFRDDIVVTTLRQLGVPESAIVHVEAGEGGTTESTQALADWIRVHPSHAIVIVIPSHARRFRRALARVWPPNASTPIVTTPRHNSFHPDDWWTTRRTLREGVVELQKLGLDYLQHPW